MQQKEIYSVDIYSCKMCNFLFLFLQAVELILYASLPIMIGERVRMKHIFEKGFEIIHVRTVRFLF